MSVLIDLSPLYQNDTSPAWTLTLTKRDGVTPINLTGLSGSNFTIKLKLQTGLQTVITGTGTTSIVSAAGGVISYQPSVNDTATVGSFFLWVIINWPNGPQHLDPIPVTIIAAP